MNDVLFKLINFRYLKIEADKSLENLRFSMFTNIFNFVTAKFVEFCMHRKLEIFECFDLSPAKPLKFEEFWGMQNFVLRLRIKASQTSKTCGF